VLAGGAVDVICERPPQALAISVKHAVTKTTSLLPLSFNPPELRLPKMQGIIAE
jgi:hypothetical protein